MRSKSQRWDGDQRRRSDGQDNQMFKCKVGEDSAHVERSHRHVKQWETEDCPITKLHVSLYYSSHWPLTPSHHFAVGLSRRACSGGRAFGTGFQVRSLPGFPCWNMKFNFDFGLLEVIQWVFNSPESPHHDNQRRHIDHRRWVGQGIDHWERHRVRERQRESLALLNSSSPFLTSAMVLRSILTGIPVLPRDRFNVSPHFGRRSTKK